MTGYVKDSGFQITKGYGFICSSGRDYFFHRSALVGLEFDEALIETSVNFELEEGDKGPKAVNVRAV